MGECDITDGALENLAINCPTLVEIEIADDIEITDAGKNVTYVTDVTYVTYVTYVTDLR
jgi:hypothetical protein